jgi:hypothetical protein
MLRWLRNALGRLPPPDVRQESDPPALIRGHVQMPMPKATGTEGRAERLGAPLTCFEGQVADNGDEQATA